jgi:hypothetical protein
MSALCFAFATAFVFVFAYAGERYNLIDNKGEMLGPFV